MFGTGIIARKNRFVYAARKAMYTARYSIEGIYVKALCKYVNETEICVTGIRRSGNHAIINWIGRQYPGKRICFLNCAKPHTNPFETGNSIYDTETIIFNDFKIDSRMEASQRFRKKDCLIYSYEDVSLSDLDDQGTLTKWVGTSRKRFNILILRDPFNMIASRMTVQFPSDADLLETVKKQMELWKEHAREFLIRRDRAERYSVGISYNHWFSSADYRSAIAKQLGFVNRDEGIDHVTRIGGGSSFDGVEYDRNAQKMQVLTRWKGFQDDPIFRNVLEDQELVNLSKEIFGDVIH